MTTPVQATVTPEDREAAHAAMGGNPERFGNLCRNQHCPACDRIAQALANAREAGRREAFGEALDAIGHPDARNIIVGLSRAARRAPIVAAEASMSPAPQNHAANRPDTSIATPGVEILVKALEILEARKGMHDIPWHDRGRDCPHCIASRALAEYGKAGT